MNNPSDIKGLRPKIIIIGVGVCVLALTAYGAVSVLGHMKATSPQTAAASGSPMPVKVQTVGSGSMSQVLGGEASAEGSEEVPVRTPLVTATVKAAHFKLGDIVKEGQPLFELDDSVQKVQLESARNDLKLARANLERSRKRVQSLQNLQKQNMATEDEVRTALLDQATIESTISSASIKEQQALADLRATQVKSPVTGVVTSGELHAGMVVRNTSDLVTLTGINPIHVVTKLGEDRIKYVHLGQEAEVSFYAFPETTFKGKVVIVNPSVDLQTRLVSVIVLVDNPDLKLMPGMSGITTLSARHDNVRVPSVAIISAGDSNAYVFVADANDVAHIRPVKTGASTDGYVEVLSGVNAGERVVVVGQASLRDKQKVRVGTEYDRSNH